MTHASLFSGIGGFDLAAEWAGWTNLFNCEIDPFCQKVLKYHFPNAEQYSDIRTTDFTIWRDRIDVLTGGFPCQPFSLAGKRKGTEDERYLWPEMLRAIREIRPRWVVGENVYGILNWSDGLVFEQVCSDLEHEGYEVQAYILPAAGVGAPHKRDRVWFVAYCADAGSKSMQGSKNGIYVTRITTDSNCTESQRSQQLRGIRCTRSVKTQSRQSRRPICSYWDEFPTQPPICGRNDGFPGRISGITVPRWTKEAIQALGNAIVPQAIFQIYQIIEILHAQTKIDLNERQ